MIYQQFRQAFALGAAAFALCVGVFSSPASAKEVSIEHDGKVLLADLVEPETLAFPGIVLITHGTLAHKDMELVEALQEGLAFWGIPSLAHTLSAGVSERRGIFDCATPMRHLPGDDADEVAIWAEWLKEQGWKSIEFLGHGRGAKAQAAAARDAKPNAMIMLAPMTSAGELRERELYVERFGVDITASVAKAAAAAGDDAMIDVPGLFFCKDVKAHPETVHAYFAGNPVGAEKLAPAIDAPLLVISAGKDELSYDVAESFADLPQADIRVIESADHLFSDFFAEDAVTHIGDFIAGIVPGGGLADKDYGEYLAQECTACHSPKASGGVPPIDGMGASYFRLAMKEYATAYRENPVMQSVARSLGEEELAALAVWFGTQRPEQD